MCSKPMSYKQFRAYFQALQRAAKVRPHIVAKEPYKEKKIGGNTVVFGWPEYT